MGKFKFKQVFMTCSILLIGFIIGISFNFRTQGNEKKYNIDKNLLNAESSAYNTKESIKKQSEESEEWESVNETELKLQKVLATLKNQTSKINDLNVAYVDMEYLFQAAMGESKSIADNNEKIQEIHRRLVKKLKEYRDFTINENKNAFIKLRGYSNKVKDRKKLKTISDNIFSEVTKKLDSYRDDLKKDESKIKIMRINAMRKILILIRTAIKDYSKNKYFLVLNKQFNVKYSKRYLDFYYVNRGLNDYKLNSPPTLGSIEGLNKYFAKLKYPKFMKVENKMFTPEEAKKRYYKVLGDYVAYFGMHSLVLHGADDITETILKEVYRSLYGEAVNKW